VPRRAAPFRGLDPACAEAVSLRALEIGALTYKSIASILDHNPDRRPQTRATDGTAIVHANISRRRLRRPASPTLLPLRRSPMLHHPTLDLLHELGLHGMAQGFGELANHADAGPLDHAEWLALLLEREATLRRQKSFEARARPPSCATRRVSRISITAPCAASTGPCS
jgi:hypothetical protein